MRLVWLVMAGAVCLVTPMRMLAQQTLPQESQMPGMAMPAAAQTAAPMEMGSSPAAQMLLMQSSGTDVQPRAWQMPQIMRQAGGWQLMFMGQAFVTDVQQTGLPGGAPPGMGHETGADKLYSTNNGMLAAVHPLGPGAIMLRAMLSLEPATISDRRYPELFQTGETAYGVPIVDGQHPHNLFMELAAQIAEPLNSRTLGYIYYAPVGDPALGPAAYPHRVSASELPQAALGHHYEDSTHIAYNVATIGVEHAWLRLEASGFVGREPGENRWTIGFAPMDSWAVRAAIAPTSHIAAQVSTGRLTHPEQASTGDEERTTASVEYVRAIAGQSWASSLIWGRDFKTDGHYAVNALTAETVVPAGARNLFTFRYEWSQRDELFDAAPAIKQQFLAEGLRWFDVNAFTPGYTRVLGNWHSAEIGLGAKVTAYVVPDSLRAFYGRAPFGASLYLRARLKSAMRGR